MKIRKAIVADAPAAHKLINDFASLQLMLPRSLNAIYGNIREYFVCYEDDLIVGVCALHILWENLAEVKSLAVLPSNQRRGIGGQLVRHCLEESSALGVNRVFALTYVPDFFIKCGFEKIDKSDLPHKTWSDCINCPKFPSCDEQAVIINLQGISCLI
ncbi:MAG: N-acetyltransferase [Nitrospirae bacterium]|nr:N-acetyltransferase [Nitrospirota bacterium]